MKKIELINKRFGRLLVKKQSESIRIPTGASTIMWECLCDCGNIKIIRGTDLRESKIRSCGCYKIECASKRELTHGESNSVNLSSEYTAWVGMKERCYNPNKKSYQDYGGRGIFVSEIWLNSFEQFLLDMGRRPSKLHSIDRIENDKGYYKDNCRWATRNEQNRNTRRNRFFSHNGKTMILSDWATYLKTNRTTIHSQLKKGISFSIVYEKYKHKI